MPVVLVEVGGVARSGHEYDDRTGISYEYPAGRYENWIQTGDRFVYQVPGAGYTGCGVIGEITPSMDGGRLICEVLSVRQFSEPVGLKAENGTYYEADPTYWRDKVYWGQGVRPLSDARFDAIVRMARVAHGPDLDPVGSGYADPETAQAVEDYSVAVAIEAMKSRFDGKVIVMPRNNPGYDLLVGSAGSTTRYIGVKGTQTAEPVFFMSEGDRRFSVRNEARYTLVVVSGIDLVNETHQRVTIRDGAVGPPDVALKPNQWRGRLVSPRGESPS